MATWDDHDYGENDAGKEFYLREESQAAVLRFLRLPRG
jgi:alkaline phosphatase D